jgi:hypothetical protein
MAEDDIADLFDVCVVTLNCTPDSLRQDFHCMLFGSNLVDDYTDFPLNRLICLPVSAQEIFKKVVDLNLPKLAGQVGFCEFIFDEIEIRDQHFTFSKSSTTSLLMPERTPISCPDQSWAPTT